MLFFCAKFHVQTIHLYCFVWVWTQCMCIWNLIQGSLMQCRGLWDASHMDGGSLMYSFGDLESLMYSLWRIWSEQWISYWHFEKLGNQIDRPRILRREKREDEDRNRREGGSSVLSHDDRSVTVVALVQEGGEGVKSKSFLRQENPSEL